MFGGAFNHVLIKFATPNSVLTFDRILISEKLVDLDTYSLSFSKKSDSKIYIKDNCFLAYNNNKLSNKLDWPILRSSPQLYQHNVYFRSANSLASTEIERIWIPFIVFENTEKNEATM